MAIWTTFICWYVNQSFIFFFDDLFQILAVYENFHIGQVLCASCPDSHTLITGGTSTVSMTSQVVCMTRRNYALAQGIEKRKEVEMVNCIKDSVYWLWLCKLILISRLVNATFHFTCSPPLNFSYLVNNWQVSLLLWCSLFVCGTWWKEGREDRRLFYTRWVSQIFSTPRGFFKGTALCQRFSRILTYLLPSHPPLPFNPHLHPGTSSSRTLPHSTPEWLSLSFPKRYLSY